eukprot:2922153-Amphidinium_carterae.1
MRKKWHNGSLAVEERATCIQAHCKASRRQADLPTTRIKGIAKFFKDYQHMIRNEKTLEREDVAINICLV